MDSDSLLFCMLANELEIAGLRATQSPPPSAEQALPIPAYPHKRQHLTEQPAGRNAGMSASLSTAELAKLQSSSGSYGQEPLHSSASEEDNCSWYEQQPAAHPSATATATASMPAAQPTADMSAVSKLKMLLATNSVVRQTALKLLLQAPQPAQQQAQQMLGHRQHLPQQQQPAHPWSAGVAGCSEIAYSTLPHSTQSAHASLLEALRTGSSFTGRSGAYRSTRPSPQPELPADGFPANFPAAPMPAHVTCSDETDGWAAELEGQLLGTLRRDAHSQAFFPGSAAAPCVGSANQHNSSSNLPGMQLLQQHHMSQQPQRGVYRHYHAPDSKQTTQQQQQAYGVQYQQQNWGAVPHANGMLAAAAAPNMTLWQSSTLNYAATEGLMNSEHAGFSPDPVSVSSSDTTGSAGAAHGSAHSIPHMAAGTAFSNRQAAPNMGGQEHGHMHTGVKRASSMDQDMLLYNLLQEMAPAGRR